jgi:mono/diheme cytochrome c family protein
MHRLATAILPVVCHVVVASVATAQMPFMMNAAPCQQPTVQCPPAGIHDVGGSWQWTASRDEQRRHAAGIYNRYCVRCHGVDGRGVWDVPDVPNFADSRWQSSRTDEQLARLTWEGRGAVMPAFRGTLTWQETWAVAYYIRDLAIQKPSRAARPARSQNSTEPETNKTSSNGNYSPIILRNASRNPETVWPLPPIGNVAQPALLNTPHR